LLGIAAGSAIGFARVTQGAHFPSDVLWSGGMVYLSGLFLTVLVNTSKPAKVPVAMEAKRTLTVFVDEDAVKAAQETVGVETEEKRQRAAA
jgi:membrane-associated phospholipid phosphatase